jgi:hypothetical protein
MSHKSILRGVLLLVVIASVGLSVTLARASWETGSQVGASWVSGPSEMPE